MEYFHNFRLIYGEIFTAFFRIVHQVYGSILVIVRSQVQTLVAVVDSDHQKSIGRGDASSCFPRILID